MADHLPSDAADAAVDVFSNLVKGVTVSPAALSKAPRVPCLTKTDHMLLLLKTHGRLTAEQLTTLMDLDLRLVWGLVKGPMERGQVLRAGGAFELNEDFISTKVTKAVALLRGLGFQVEPPERQAISNG